MKFLCRQDRKNIAKILKMLIIDSGGETASTWIGNCKWHAEVLSARKTGRKHTTADNYGYALAA